MASVIRRTWRIRGSGLLRGRAAAVLRALWQWREQKRKRRPATFMFCKYELLSAAVSFASESCLIQAFFLAPRQAFREAAQSACNCPRGMAGLAAPLRNAAKPWDNGRTKNCDGDGIAARELDLEPTFIAPRSTLEQSLRIKLARNFARSWQRVVSAIEW